MFKKAFKVATVLTLLAGCYAGYVQVFALVVKSLETSRRNSDISFVKKMSKSKLDSIASAKKSFGAEHWTSDDKTDCFIKPDFMLYFKDHEQPEKFDGKRMILKPVALIIRTDGGKSTITVTAEEGTFTSNQRPGLSGKSAAQHKQNPKAGAEPFKILKAQLSRNVMLRHDRGTPDDPDDDLFVGPLTYADFDDASLQIASESDVLIRDRDITMTGQQFLIQLRPKANPSVDGTAGTNRSNGFDGVKTAILKKNVHVVFRDVGRTGFLPGSGPVKKGDLASKTTGPAGPDASNPDRPGDAPPPEPKPLDLTSAGQMTVNFPEPRRPVRIGPPAPPLPTFITFNRDVLTQIGKLDEKPDQLSCDTLELVLFPAESPKPVKPKEEAASSPTGPSAKTAHEQVATTAESRDATTTRPKEDALAEGGTFGNLALRDLKATGYVVWLKLSKQTTTIRGVELKHHKGGPGQLDVTNMLGKKGPRGLAIVKIDEVPDGPDKGKIAGVTNVWGDYATIYDDGGDTNNATIYIKGPGLLETRTDPSQPAQRIAEWQDVLEVLEEPGPDSASPTKRVTLVGVPFVRDLSKPDQPSSLDAEDQIIAWLKPKPPGTAGARAQQDPTAPLSPGSSGYDLHKLQAYKDVHLISPGQNINARKRLDAEFQPAPVAAVPANPATPAPAVVAKNAEQPAPADPAAAPKQERAQPAKPKAAPDRKVDADIVWADVQLLPPANPSPSTNRNTTGSGAPPTAGGANASPQYEVREVRLNRRVVFHQDPEEGKTKGNDATGEALYLFNEGENKVRMVLFNEVPKKQITKVGVSAPPPAPPRQNLPPAWISTEEMQLSGPIIGMDQTKDFAWVNGPGTLKQMVDRGMMADKNPIDSKPGSTDPAKDGEASAKADPKDAPLKIQTRAGKPLSEKTELTINWTEKMWFFGRSPDRENRPDSAARAEFYGHVTAITEEKDSLLDCDEKMITYTDRPIPFTKLSKAGAARNASSGGNDPQAQAEQEPEPKPDLALIEMFGNAVAVNRKVDPNRPLILQKQRIETDHLIYDRRTGNFLAPGQGIVHLYDRKGSEPDVKGGVGVSDRRTTQGREVIQTSMLQDQDAGYGSPSSLDMEQQTQADEEDTREESEVRSPASPRSMAPSNARAPGRQGRGVPRVAGTTGRTRNQTTKPLSEDLAGVKPVPPLVLTQIRFAREMRGQFGTSNKPGVSETRTADFFGDVEVVRSPVADEFGIVDRKDWNFRPPPDVYFLTSQTLRVITEPAAPGSPPNAPSKTWLKAWENAQISTNDKTLQADIITYNSTKDRFYASGEDGHQVTITQQAGVGQPSSPTRQQAVEYHPKTGKVTLVNPQYIQFVDTRTGSRPNLMKAPNPDAKPKKKVKPPMKPRIMPMERKGFTGR